MESIVLGIDKLFFCDIIHINSVGNIGITFGVTGTYKRVRN